MFDQNAYQQEHASIWATYQEKYRHIYQSDDPNVHSTLIMDGVVNPDSYGNVLFFLKEAHSTGTDEIWDICPWLNDGVHHNLWNRVAEWAYGLSRTTADNVHPYSAWNGDDKLNALRSIALVNVKKIKGLSSSSYDDLIAQAKDNADLLRREVLATQPKIIVCGSTFSYLTEIFGGFEEKQPTLNSQWCHIVDLSEELKDVLVIDFYHPAASYPALFTYYGITNVYQQYLKEQSV